MSKLSLATAAIAVLMLGLGAAAPAGAKTAGTTINSDATSTNVAYPPKCWYKGHPFPRPCKRW